MEIKPGVVAAFDERIEAFYDAITQAADQHKITFFEFAGVTGKALGYFIASGESVSGGYDPQTLEAFLTGCPEAFTANMLMAYRELMEQTEGKKVVQ